MIVAGMAAAYLAIGVIAALVAARRLGAADAVALALLWPIYGPILLERRPHPGAPPTVRVDEARRELAAALAEAERVRRVEALRAQIAALEAELEGLRNKAPDPDVDR
jgi:hypothetical protein